MLGTIVLTLGLSLAAPPSSSTPPGGYWGVGESPEPPPPDGDELIYVGGALAPLGALGTGAAIASMVYGMPGRCPLEPDQCQRLLLTGYAGLGSAALMLVTGATVLGVGLVQRARHRAWKKRHNLARLRPIQLAPWWGPGAASVRVGSRARRRRATFAGGASFSLRF